jgi:hypothetical protein
MLLSTNSAVMGQGIGIRGPTVLERRSRRLDF